MHPEVIPFARAAMFGREHIKATGLPMGRHDWALPVTPMTAYLRNVVVRADDAATVMLNDINGLCLYGPFTMRQARILTRLCGISDDHGIIIPLEMRRDGFGSLPNMVSHNAYRLVINGKGNLHVKVNGWTLPALTTGDGIPQERFPQYLGACQYTGVMHYSENQPLIIHRVGNTIRSITVVFTDADGNPDEHAVGLGTMLVFDNQIVANLASHEREPGVYRIGLVGRDGLHALRMVAGPYGLDTGVSSRLEVVGWNSYERCEIFVNDMYMTPYV